MSCSSTLIQSGTTSCLSTAMYSTQSRWFASRRSWNWISKPADVTKQPTTYCDNIGVVTMDGFWIGLDDWIYWHLIHTTLNYRQLQRSRWSTHFIVQCYKHWCSQSSPVVSGQRIYKSLTVTAAHKKSSLHSLIPFLPFFLSYSAISWDSLNSLLQLPSLLNFRRAQLLTASSLGTPELDSVLILAARDPLYIVSVQPPQKTPLFYCCVRSLPRECVYRAVA
jgi:hypothetical protein